MHHASDAALPGLATSEAGYTLLPTRSTLPSGSATPFTFTITGPDGHPLTDGYDLSHEKELHLIAVRRDLSGFQHVHPIRDGSGTWSGALDVTAAGSWRVFADFAPAALGRGITLGADVAVAGAFEPVPLPDPAASTVIDGYRVDLTGTSAIGMSDLVFTVSRAGAPVTDLEPYLGAFGHLVTLRVGDLAYLHTHPAQEAHTGDRGGPVIAFESSFPTSGSYRLFLDFQAGGAVHTAEFTVVVPGPGALR